MNDRELLELAAKAAGYRPDGIFGRGLLVVMNVGQPDQCAFPFDPLNDDGDALRLAVRLGVRMDFPKYWVVAYSGSCASEQFSEPHDGDPYAATRRAIVRAAAEIGKAIP
jgi:hypothetical protein